MCMWCNGTVFNWQSFRINKICKFSIVLKNGLGFISLCVTTFSPSIDSKMFTSWKRDIDFIFRRFLTYGFPCESAGKESVCNAGDLGSIPGLWRSPGEGKDYSLQYPGLENSMDSPSGRKESDTTEWLSLKKKYFILAWTGLLRSVGSS